MIFYQEIARAYATPAAIVFSSSMLFGINVLNRYDLQKTTEKIDNTHLQLENTRTHLFKMLDDANKEINTIDQETKNMNAEITIIRGGFTLGQIVAGNARQVKLVDIIKSKAEGEE
ncbi:hypothetical protein B9Z19DRAFT_510893 [Tuber borchii]|uniref:Uncharacterized protein n=1 Tax=Tuber borchii TaxID=42251 RepID=A0A2T6ZE46_TUBBO|nr:hypothetical protein B9Z19DRAFT_510893 [Tuber borchii]